MNKNYLNGDVRKGLKVFVIICSALKNTRGWVQMCLSVCNAASSLWLGFIQLCILPAQQLLEMQIFIQTGFQLTFQSRIGITRRLLQEWWINKRAETQDKAGPLEAWVIGFLKKCCCGLAFSSWSMQMSLNYLKLLKIKTLQATQHIKSHYWSWIIVRVRAPLTGPKGFTD